MEQDILSLLDTPVIGDATGSVTILNIIVVTVVMTVVFVALRSFRRFVVTKLTSTVGARTGTIHSLMLILNYSIGVVIFLVLIQAAGVNLQALTVVFGALSVGIGFGLQSVINNFFCGIVMLFERPVRIGDRVVLDQHEGDVVELALRATKIRTNEGVTVVVPNSQFINATVVNRSLYSQRVRIKIPVNVSYDADPRLVEQVLLGVARSHTGVLVDPSPIVIFEEFGSSALHFFLWVWTEEFSHSPLVFKSELNFLISNALVQAKIQIPMPQLEVKVRS